MTRVGKFAVVGLIGWVVQLITLSTLLWCGVHYLVGTMVAVELTILHNFTWHELYTWRDQEAASAAAVAARLFRFHGSTALVSVVGNVVLTGLAVECLHIPAAIANAAAVSLLSALNYATANRWVFAAGQVPGTVRSPRRAYWDGRFEKSSMPETAPH
jgi:putative flippase GtrA